MRVGVAIALLVMTAGCEGLITLASNAPPIGARGPIDVSCDVSLYPGVKIDEIANEFATTVHPDMLNAASGCISCHAVDNKRLFTVTSSGVDTFYKARAAGYFGDAPGSLISRLASNDAAAAMPKGLTPWSVKQVQEVGKIACMVRAYEQSGGTLADEQFPPELLTPYTGVKSTDYDNTFINFVQVKGKVKAVFADDWQRGGVDQWDKNIGLFGGVNFKTNFVEARAATPEFLLGLDVLAPDVCGVASKGLTGPFAGLNLTAAIIDTPPASTQTVEAENVAPTGSVGSLSTNPAGFFCYTNCALSTDLIIAAPGTYQVVVRAKADPNLAGNPTVSVVVGGVPAQTVDFTNAAAYEDKTLTFTVPTAGLTTVAVSFVNDASSPTDGDRNIWFDNFKVIGPIGTATGTARETAAKATIDTLYQRMLFRPANATDATTTYALLKDLTGLGTLTDAWAGVCEALVHHPDFLFTLPPSADTATGAEKDRALLVSLTQSLVGRPPKTAELDALTKAGLGPVIDSLLASPEFQTYYFGRIQLRIETQGTPVSDEPARLWTWIAMNGRPFSEILTADYTIDERYQKQPRPAEHGHTGVLTMKGYLASKPGLPHFNYPARVMSAFMGSIFEVPPEVFDKRGTATAASTVDPTSICFSCHQMLTPLAYQRSKWADDGTYREVDARGAAIDDSDRELVPTYPYKGRGMESFSTKAVNKEAFIRRMLNAQFKLLMGRDLRHAEDERGLYKKLWDTTVTGHGDLKAIIKTVALSETFQRKAQ